jgi:hypothetical protein
MEMKHDLSDMAEVSTLRLYLLRAMYLLIAVGLGLTIWPGILAPGNASHMGSVARSITAPGDPWSGPGSGPRQTTS